MEVVISTAEILTTDGVPLKQSLRKAERKNKVRAFLLVFPLLLFIIVTFVMPIGDMLLRSVDDAQINTVFPKTFEEYKKWDREKDELPPEAVYRTLFEELATGEKIKIEHYRSADKEKKLTTRVYRIMPNFFQALAWFIFYLAEHWNLKGVNLDKWKNTSNTTTMMSFLVNLDTNIFCTVSLPK